MVESTYSRVLHRPPEPAGVIAEVSFSTNLFDNFPIRFKCGSICLADRMDRIPPRVHPLFEP
jgi:hypothetical protein